jgi:hypothetical protein
MKALSIRQPYATLVCAGVKDVENRSWSTKYRGRLLIHASRWSGARDVFDRDLPLPVFHEFDRMIESDGTVTKPSRLLKVEKDRLVYTGKPGDRREYELLKTEIACQADEESTLFAEHAIIGHVELLDVIEDSDSRWSEDGFYHWILGDAVLYQAPALEVKGRLRIWDTDIILDEVAISYVER